MLDPPPISTIRWRIPQSESSERVILVEVGPVSILIPHRICDDNVEFPRRGAIQKLRVPERVTDDDLAFHVMNDHVHLGHGVCDVVQFLTKEFQG